MRKSLWVILLNLLYLLGSAQNITVSPELVCPNQTSSLITDSTRNVHIGDIVCVDNTGDTLIVSPSQWEALSNTLTPLSVVFFVDETGQHGWGVGSEIQHTTFSDDYSNEDISSSPVNYISTLPYTYNDFYGLTNTENIQSFTPDNYPNFPNEPFYLPALGQLSILYAQLSTVHSIMSRLFEVPVWENLLQFPWWSSTIGLDENDWDYIWCLSAGSAIVESYYTTLSHYFIPVMNF